MFPKQADSGYREYIGTPCGIGGTRTEQRVAIGCALTLGAIFVLEVGTPNDVVGALALLPLTAAAWMLSTRMAALILGAGALFFIATVLLESRNRLTLLLVAISVLVTAGFVRFWATSLSARRVADDNRGGAFGSPAVPTFQVRNTDAAASLTRRELEVARLAALAYTAAEIGRQLHIGERTVESHIASTYVKLGIKSRSELIRIASRLG
jgi:DNA-binding CsgD family transcriptional regulator